MKIKILSFFLLFSGMYQFTSAFNDENLISKSSTVLTINSFTFADDATDLTITVNGNTVNAASHHLFIDLDNDPLTGDPNNGGADFRVENTGTNRWVSGAWAWEWHAGNIVVTDNPGVSVQFKIKRSYLPLTNSGSQINVYFTNLADFVPVIGERYPAIGVESYTTVNGTPPPNLTSLTVTGEDATTLTMTLLGPGITSDYDFFIDTDNSTSTGLTTNGIGANILLQNGISYAFSGANQATWSWTPHPTSAITSVTDIGGQSRVFVLSKSILGLTATASTFKSSYSQTISNVQILPLVTYTTGTLSIVNNLSLRSINIFKTNNSTLKINGLTQGKSNIKLFDMFGKQVLNVAFILNGVQDIALPNLNSGIYIISLETELGVLTKKIIL